MALFPVTSNPSWRQAAIIISSSYICTTAHSIHLYSTHRAVIFVIAQVPCMYKMFAFFSVSLNGLTTLYHCSNDICCHVLKGTPPYTPKFAKNRTLIKISLHWWLARA